MDGAFGLLPDGASIPYPIFSVMIISRRISAIHVEEPCA